jgi:geranylgeranyl transferase type-2 subunit alpha
VLQALLSEKQDVNDVASELRDDLRFLVPLMLKFPKCYWIWKYRSWLLEQSTERLPASSARIIWKEELALVSKLLSRDGRNFHGWGYRRVVVEALESDALQVEGQDDEQSLVTSEIEYTKKMIYGNLSNFSAWHTRSKLIIRMLDEEHADDERRKATFDNGTYQSPKTSSPGLTA